ncbi:YihY/virulence factor BrkB family protein [Aridibaculum aurantiacum]|uniref:YihY/virulence factor BrkB family protein n=1 Tax=Aridibaculum aurantiacum TaxID=2810307 RepID=UPI001A96D19F|nr:YihY/virulence factor BrkB family protein [Aridibaculum aurantiacum]
MQEKITAKGLFGVLKEAGKGFGRDKVPKLSGSLAYYTIFSLGPMLLIMIYLANLFWADQAIEGKLVGQLGTLIGEGAAKQIQEIIINASLDETSTFAAAVGITTLIIGATTVFAEIQDSINMIWNLRLKKDTGWWKLVLTRILSFSIVIALGFLLLVSLIINSLLEGLMDKIREEFPGMAVTVIYIINLLLTLLVTTTLFAIIYKVLPDAKIRWRDVAVGALFAACLFMLAKFGITFYIGQSNIGSAYGAAGSLVVLIMWIYFSSMILYFGAEFTKAYALKYGGEITPNEYTVTIQRVEVESNKKSIQENEADSEETQKQTQEQKDMEA